jgi:uncharacterized protein (DUF2461 family)
MMTAAAMFAGFPPAAFAFLSELRDNNDPAWFKPRKAAYEAEVLAPFRDLIIALGEHSGEPGCHWSAILQYFPYLPRCPLFAR